MRHEELGDLVLVMCARVEKVRKRWNQLRRTFDYVVARQFVVLPGFLLQTPLFRPAHICGAVPPQDCCVTELGLVVNAMRELFFHCGRSSEYTCQQTTFSTKFQQPSFQQFRITLVLLINQSLQTIESSGRARWASSLQCADEAAAVIRRSIAIVSLDRLYKWE